jgi:hypothetical protein
MVMIGSNQQSQQRKNAAGMKRLLSTLWKDLAAWLRRKRKDTPLLYPGIRFLFIQSLPVSIQDFPNDRRTMFLQVSKKTSLILLFSPSLGSRKRGVI